MYRTLNFDSFYLGARIKKILLGCFYPYLKNKYPSCWYFLLLYYSSHHTYLLESFPLLTNMYTGGPRIAPSLGPKRIELNGDWFSTKTCEIGQVPFFHKVTVLLIKNYIILFKNYHPMYLNTYCWIKFSFFWPLNK